MQDMVWCNLFLFTSIRGPARSCMLVLQGRGGGHWRMFTLWPFGLLWVMGMALAWDKVNHQEDTTQQTFRNDTTRLQRHDCADLEVKFPHNPPSRCFRALTTVNDDHRKYFSRRSGDWLDWNWRKGAMGWERAGLAARSTQPFTIFVSRARATLPLNHFLGAAQGRRNACARQTW